MPAATLPLRDLCLAVAVVAVWGTNFVVIRIGLDHLPPLLFAALRFLLAAIPGVFLLPRPAVPWRNLATYGILIGAGQFGLLFIASIRVISYVEGRVVEALLGVRMPRRPPTEKPRSRGHSTRRTCST